MIRHITFSLFFSFVVGCTGPSAETAKHLHEPRFVVSHSTGGWGYTREWRVFNNRLVVGRPHWNEEAKAQEFAVEYSRRLNLHEFGSLEHTWAQLDARLWTHSVAYTDLLTLSDGPCYGLKQGNDRSGRQLFVSDFPIKEMLPAVDAVAYLLPTLHQPRFHPTEHPYVWRKHPEVTESESLKK